ncbi:hypothetical protein FKM82_005917 [Ascaphus truei]
MPVSRKPVRSPEVERSALLLFKTTPIQIMLKKSIKKKTPHLPGIAACNWFEIEMAEKTDEIVVPFFSWVCLHDRESSKRDCGRFRHGIVL